LSPDGQRIKIPLEIKLPNPRTGAVDEDCGIDHILDLEPEV
jgi:hypothetical protein